MDNSEFNTRIELAKIKEEYLSQLHEEVLKYYPTFAPLIEMRIFSNSQEKKLVASGAELKTENIHYKKTPYYYNNDSRSFLHFTNLKSVISILHSQSVYLKTLGGMNDLNEISYAAKVFNLDAEQLNNMKREIFSFSLVEYSNEILGSNSENLDLWRFYGNDGHGCAIKFRIENDLDRWNFFHLSKIQYGDKELQILIDLKSHIDKFNQKHTSFYIYLPNIFSFHKSNHFINESEVRLIFRTYFDKDEHRYINTNSTLVNQQYPSRPEKINGTDDYFIKIPLYNKSSDYNLQSSFFNFGPKIVVEGIILGYRFKESELGLYRDVFQSITNSANGVPITNDNISITRLAGLFR